MTAENVTQDLLTPPDQAKTTIQDALEAGHFASFPGALVQELPRQEGRAEQALRLAYGRVARREQILKDGYAKREDIEDSFISQSEIEGLGWKLNKTASCWERDKRIFFILGGEFWLSPEWQAKFYPEYQKSDDHRAPSNSPILAMTNWPPPRHTDTGVKIGS